ncbi:MAG: metallopeptidase family protein [Alphaproteobacteria bacterium]|nr:metallopeptidase family protein [Alphaproteobacteria bacterium]
MNYNQIIMNYTTAPNLEDLEIIAQSVFETLPEEIAEYCEEMVLLVEEMADEVIESELDLDDPFDLLALYKSGKEISPGVERKNAKDDDCLMLFRRPILDMWCESYEDLTSIIRQIMIEELGRCFDFSDGEIDEMVRRHYQGAL